MAEEGTAKAPCWIRGPEPLLRRSPGEVLGPRNCRMNRPERTSTRITALLPPRPRDRRIRAQARGSLSGWGPALFNSFSLRVYRSRGTSWRGLVCRGPRAEPESAGKPLGCSSVEATQRPAQTRSERRKTKKTSGSTGASGVKGPLPHGCCGGTSPWATGTRPGLRVAVDGRGRARGRLYGNRLLSQQDQASPDFTPRGVP